MSPYTRREFVKLGAAGAAGLAVGAGPSRRADARQPRIAVIGGGVAGLTAAYTLKQLGYGAVTVFERSAEPGGKVLTDRSLGTPVELGAVFATDRYEVTLQLARDVGAELVPMPGGGMLLQDDGSLVPLREFAARKHGAVAVQRAAERYQALAARYRVFERRGFAGLAPELNAPFQEFAEKNDILPFADMFRAQSVTYGYAYYETVPALYYLKALGLVATDHFFMFPRGYQELCTRLAERLDVRCSAAVTAVRRRPGANGPRILVEVNGAEQEFERLIVATPCDATAHYLDLTGEEQDLFGRVLRNNYQVSIARVEGVKPDRSALYLYPSTHPAAVGHVACWYSPSPQLPIYAAYQNVGADQTDADARRLLEQDFREAGGGTVAGVLLHRKWDYFEHVNSAALGAGFHDRFEALQGKNGTFFATGLVALEGVETCARYARDLVREAFAPVTA